MATPLRVLIVEDSADDAELLLRDLRRGGYVPSHRRVDSAAEMRAALAEQSWDIVISDHLMPSFSALTALKLLKESGLDLPFIIVSGAIGEETAVEAMVAGAHDYVMKGRPARLLPAIHRELDEATVRRERRLAVEALRHAKEELELTVAERTAQLRAANQELQHLLEHVQAQNRELAAQSEANRALTAEAERRAATLAGMLASIPDPVFVTDECGAVVLISDAGLTQLRVSSLDQLRKPLPEWVAPYDVRAADGRALTPEEMPIGRAIRGEAFAGLETHFRDLADGSYLWTLCSGAPLLDAAGQIVGAVVAAKDITVLKDLDERKDEFLAITAHELRTPLTSMRGYTQMLLRRAERMPDGEDWVRSLRTVDGQVNRLNETVDLLLDVSRIQIGRLELRLERLDLVELANAAADEARMISGRHEIAVQPALAEMIGEWDPSKLRQVLSNLLGNAIKYSPEGGRIEIAVAQRADEAVISVQDEGIGIPREVQQRLFDRYYRAPGTSRSRAEGMGLGLYLASGIVAAHGGRMWVASEPGVGSTFSFCLPLRDRERAQPADDIQSVSSPRR